MRIHYIIFIPGIKGSSIEMNDSKKQIWPPKAILLSKISSFFNKTLLTKTEKEFLKYTDVSNSMEFKIIKKIKLLKNIITIDVYGSFLKGLKKIVSDIEQSETSISIQILIFSYDWRKSMRLSALDLYDFLKVNKKNGDFSLISHSFGGLVARYYCEKIIMEKCLNKEFIPEKVICIATPHNGSFNALSYLSGIKSVPLTSFKVSKEILNSFDSIYELLPFEHISKMYNEKKVKLVCQEKYYSRFKKMLENYRYDSFVIKYGMKDDIDIKWEMIILNLSKYFSFWDFDYSKLRKAYLTINSLNLIKKPKSTMYSFINIFGHKTLQYICPNKNLLYVNNSGDGTVSPYLSTYDIIPILNKLSKIKDRNVHLSLLKNSKTKHLIYCILKQGKVFPKLLSTKQKCIYKIFKTRFNLKVNLEINYSRDKYILNFFISDSKNKINNINFILEQYNGYKQKTTFECFNNIFLVEIKTSCAIKNIFLECFGNEIPFHNIPKT